MISPRMATMLAFVTCDAELAEGLGEAPARRRRQELQPHHGRRAGVDQRHGPGDGERGVGGAPRGRPASSRLAAALDALLLSLAVAMVADGEGASKAVRLVVDGARDAGEAERVARAVGTSPLVKTAFYGRDANWGRIVQAVGQALAAGPGPAYADAAGAAAAAARTAAGAAVTVDGAAVPAEILYEDLAVVRGGAPVPLCESAQERLADIMAQHEIDVRVVLNGGPAAATLYFSDLTHDYVTLNAEYST
jgi:glutamate N-acetyltransferase / amino-acid N-acetyltransferase